MIDKLKELGWVVLALLVFFILFVIIMFLIQGGVWMTEKIYPLFNILFGVTFWIFIIVLIPLAFFKKTKLLSSKGMMISSYVFGANLWVSSFLITYNVWGAFALFIGLIFMGIGVVPIALLATLFKGIWSTFGEIILLIIMTFGSRAFSLYLENKVENTRSYSKPTDNSIHKDCELCGSPMENSAVLVCTNPDCHFCVPANREDYLHAIDCKDCGQPLQTVVGLACTNHDCYNTMLI